MVLLTKIKQQRLSEFSHAEKLKGQTSGSDEGINQGHSGCLNQDPRGGRCHRHWSQP